MPTTIMLGLSRRIQLLEYGGAEVGRNCGVTNSFVTGLTWQQETLEDLQIR